MVSNVGSAAISAVSLVDSINNLVIQVFSAMAAGAAIVCSRFIGAKDRNGCNRAARQVVLTVFIISVAIMVFGLIFRVPLLQVVFGAIEPEVMENAMIYFLIRWFHIRFWHCLMRVRHFSGRRAMPSCRCLWRQARMF